MLPRDFQGQLLKNLSKNASQESFTQKPQAADEERKATPQTIFSRYQNMVVEGGIKADQLQQMLTESKDDRSCSPEWKLLQGGHQLDGNIIESLKETHAKGLNHEGHVKMN